MERKRTFFIEKNYITAHTYIKDDRKASKGPSRALGSNIKKEKEYQVKQNKEQKGRTEKVGGWKMNGKTCMMWRYEVILM